nr:NUDIX domain-containing protein [Paenibacillus dendrobii]
MQGNKWLVIERGAEEEHAAGTLSFAGGTVEQEGAAEEILERTVRRELLEEVGVEIQEKMHFVHSSSFVTEKGHHVINVVFICDYKEGIAHPKSPEEVAAVYWMTAEEIVHHPKAPPWTIESVKRAELLRKELHAEVD